MNDYRPDVKISKDEFKTQVRLNRGKLTKFDTELEMIFKHGIPGVIEFTLNKKLMGIENISFVATRPKNYQEKFCTWMGEKNWKAEKNELDLWFSENK